MAAAAAETAALQAAAKHLSDQAEQLQQKCTVLGTALTELQQAADEVSSNPPSPVAQLNAV